MKIAVVGCMHGELDDVYGTLLSMKEVGNTKIDLVICCGDFQAARNENDLESIKMPPKYRSMNSFWKYYSGKKVAPFPTIFIGGNHEASNYLWELYYGGWAAPNIYFLGFAGVIKFGNIRIGGISGIYNENHYHLGHYERPPYNERDIASVYHVREYDVHKLMQVEEPIDIFISHDWPRAITCFGDWKELVRHKPYFEKEIQERTLGSKPAAELLGKLKPSYWFSAHLHCKFAAIVQDRDGGRVTKFLALDKCLPGRDFLQVIEIDTIPGHYEIQYDEEWLAITRKYNSIFPLTMHCANLRGAQVDLEDCRDWVKSRLLTRGAKPFEFVKSVPCYDPSLSGKSGFSGHHRNPQTEFFLKFLELPYLLDHTSESKDLTQKPIPSIHRGSATLPVQEGSCVTWRSNFYTVPMSASSINKRKIRDLIHQDYLAPLSDHGSYGHTAQMSSSLSDSCGNSGSYFYTDPISAFSSNKREKMASDQMQLDFLTPPSNYGYRATMVQTSSSLSGTLLVQEDSCLTSIFDFHTDAASAFSSNKRQSKVGGQGCLTPPYNSGHVAALAQMPSSLPGPKKYETIASPSFSIQPNFSPADGINQVQGLYYSPGQYTSPVEMASSFHSHQQTPGAWSAPNDKSSCSAVSNSPRSVNFPCRGSEPGGGPRFSSVRGRGHLFSSRPRLVSGHEGSPSYNSRRGRGGSNMSRGSGRGCGRGLGPRAKVSAWDHPELFRKKSMEEDPWKFLKPVVGDIASEAAGAIPDSRKSWLPKSVIMEKPKVSEAAYESSSKQSLAKYLAAAFNEAVDDSCTS